MSFYFYFFFCLLAYRTHQAVQPLGSTSMEISTVEIFVNHRHDVGAPESILGCVHVIPGPFQLFKMIFDTLVICACLRITRLVNIKMMIVNLGHY
jgi:hypothetical protein